MGKRGVKPKPEKLAAPSGWPDFRLPDETSDDVRAVFARLAARLADVGTLDQTDPLLVLTAARTSVLIDRAWLDVEREGTTLPTNNGMQMAHPMVGVIANHGNRLRALLADMGLTPASAKLTQPRADDANPFKDFLNVVG